MMVVLVMVMVSCRTNYWIIYVIVRDVINYVKLANTINCIVKSLIDLVSLENTIAII